MTGARALLAANAARQDRVRAVLARIAALSFEIGFEWLVLNGLPQAEQLYPDARLRDPGAIDLLIAPGALVGVAEAMRAAGFVASGGSGSRAALAHAGLRADSRVVLTDPETDEPVHLQQRLFFAGNGVPLLDAYRSRRSAHRGDVPAPPVGAAMALDILLRGNARRWAKRKWLLDLSAVLRLLDADEVAELLRAIDRIEFAPGTAASLIHARDMIEADMPVAIDAWLESRARQPEVAVRIELYREGLGKPVIPQVVKAPAARGLWARLRARFARMPRRPLQYTSEPATRVDRYPLAFRFARQQLGVRENLRILSFGCSSGEEVLTLRGYFPGAALKGIDVDPRLIATARERMAGDPGITFEIAGTAAGEAVLYDAIFCMAVFRDPALDLPETRRAAGPVTFGAFEREIGEMVRCLKPGGLLFVEHANFRVMDTGAAASLKAVLHSDPPGSGLEPGLYGPDGLRVDGAVDRSLGFVKAAA